MRHQQVTVDIWNMMKTSGTYLALAFSAWVLVKLVNACFWLPGYLHKQRDVEMKKKADEKQQKEEEKKEDSNVKTDDSVGEPGPSQEEDSAEPETKKDV